MNQTADVFVVEQLKPPLDLVTVVQERILHKQNKWIRILVFVLLIILPVIFTQGHTCEQVCVGGKLAMC